MNIFIFQEKQGKAKENRKRCHAAKVEQPLALRSRHKEITRLPIQVSLVITTIFEYAFSTNYDQRIF